jgi:phage regulator Rha-like protein
MKIDEKNIENKIYEIRGVQVMLDSDLAELYQCANGTKDINKAVKRNIERFPNNFMFQLTNEEFNNLRFQIGTSNIKGGRRYKPYVFTEHGVAMLSSVLHSKTAINISIKIINAFVKMRHYLIENKDIYKSLNNINVKLLEHDEKINKIFNRFEPKENLYLKGQIYDAYSKIIDIFKLAKEELIIIDSYADKTLLDMISKFKVKVILITKDSERLSELDIEKYNCQYNNLKVIRNNTFHDRYIIIDKKEVYHLGTSINNAGNGIFSINKLEDEFVINTLLDKIGDFKYE